jgi:hypothetical protein
LAYAFTGDPVGPWYEAALPGRQAFCMRDTAHQGLGAHMLGLAQYTRNMLYKFAENISKSKDWCSYCFGCLLPHVCLDGRSDLL